MTRIASNETIGVIGAGTMGLGIAQVAAQAGHPVLIFDKIEGAAAKGEAHINLALEKRVRNEKLAETEHRAIMNRISVVSTLDALGDASLIIEAIIENLEIKTELFAKLEAITPKTTIFSTNTSSISITSIAQSLQHPERLVGMHFFNPAPVMKLVEIISGMATSSEVAKRTFDTAEAWGKIAVHAKSTPGFIVNRVARPFYAEALRLYEENVSDPTTIDALLTEGAGFRMGPFALMDLIGNDVNYTVCKSIFDAYYQEPRFRPSILQLEMVNAGYLGRKTGRGFYHYEQDAKNPTVVSETIIENSDPLEEFDISQESLVEGVMIVPSDGKLAAERAREFALPVIVTDIIDPQNCTRLGFSVSKDVKPEFIARFVAHLQRKSIATNQLPDWPALICTRTLSMLANEAFETVMQGVASIEGVDNAMRYGVNYPKGPIAWAREIGLHRILSVLDNLYTLTKDPRYRASLALRIAVDENP